MSKVFLDGWDKYQIHDLNKDDLEGMKEMILSAKLPERRKFNELKNQIERVLNI